MHGIQHNRTSGSSRVILLLVGLFLVTAAQAQNFSVIHTFTGGADGANPIAGLTVDRAGNLYGTASAGGNGGNGTVFKLRNPGSGWIFQRLYAFSGSDGAHPAGRVIFGPDGALYGSTEYGGDYTSFCATNGCGTVFKLTPSASFCASISCPWRETVLYAFVGGSSGQYPFADLSFDSQGDIYGTTNEVGLCATRAPLGCATVYQLKPENGGWVPELLARFDYEEPFCEVSPHLAGGVVLDSAGNLYGAVALTGYGLCSYPDYVFKITDSSGGWTLSFIHIFGDGADPQGGLIIDGAGNLYGTTVAGGSNGGGTAYELATDGSDFNVLYSFSGSHGGPVDKLVMDTAGNLYGTIPDYGAYGYGSVFELSPSAGGWIYSDLYDFTGGSDGGHPSGSVALDANGNLYGTTPSGGSGNGVVWEIPR